MIAILVVILTNLANLTIAETFTVKSIGIIYANGPASTDDYLYDELSYMDKYHPGTILPSGERMMFRLGQEYAHTYKDLTFSLETNNFHEVYSYSDSRNKCADSAKSFLLGLHGPGSGDLMGSSNQN
jgi:hypothetical protein